ncbi:metallophosphoesterase [Priestia taiwanensis]|uniref:Metallophosphoesterase n=1 Tax=Priestia taiwanensis TaxID=1347902 RepID=A0A917AQ44_9BACI|nr:metallophosphoesterase [Priestia taiwanensis]MBM7363070.1 putative MPP superfamily phosphohydrolase [Priestia taiwanensis]GGE67430.1 metallophosphoesterase [Priestia taiwanensis]
MTKKVSRRIFLKRSIQFSLFSLASSLFGYAYARKIEPILLDIVEHDILSTYLPPTFNGVKILQFSDTHLSDYYTLHQLDKLVETINEQKPDIVIFSGDLIDNFQTYKEADDVAPILKKIHAPLGKFSIYGNHDHGGYGTQKYRQIMEDADFRLLVDETVRISHSSGSSINVAGLDDFMLGKPKIEQTLESMNKQDFNLLLIHEPDIADRVKGYPIDLQLSGHSHGGQVQVPFYGPVITPPLGQKYVEGFYTIPHSSTRMKLYVNRGIGTVHVPCRFLCMPELTIFTLKQS